MLQVEWADGTMRNKRTETHALRVHKSFFEYGKRDDDAEKQRKVFAACLKIAGGYEGKEVIIGLASDSQNCAKITVDTEQIDVVIKNPMHVPQNDLEDLLGEEEIPSDSIFPSNKHRLELDNNSALEAKCFLEAAKRTE